MESDDAPHVKSSIARNWWPISCAEWPAISPDGYWEPNEISWVLPRFYELPRISHPDMRPENFKFEDPRALAAFPAFFKNATRAVVTGAYKGKTSWLYPAAPTKGKGPDQILTSRDDAPPHLIPDWTNRWEGEWSGTPANR